jgi:hypothetical protein
VMIVCQHCGFISQHALQPLGLWDHAMTHGDAKPRTEISARA